MDKVNELLTDFQYKCQDISTTQTFKTELRAEVLAAIKAELEAAVLVGRIDEQVRTKIGNDGKIVFHKYDRVISQNQRFIELKARSSAQQRETK